MFGWAQNCFRLQRVWEECKAAENFIFALAGKRLISLKFGFNTYWMSFDLYYFVWLNIFPSHIVCKVAYGNVEALISFPVYSLSHINFRIYLYKRILILRVQGHKGNNKEKDMKYTATSQNRKLKQTIQITVRFLCAYMMQSEI